MELIIEGWRQILALALTTGLATALLNNIGALALEKWKASADLRSRALPQAAEIVVALERYAKECEDALNQNENHRSSNGHIGDLTTRIPQFPLLERQHWNSISGQLSTRYLSIPTLIENSGRTIRFMASILNDDETFDLVQRELSNVGYEACLLSAELRQAYKLGEGDLLAGVSERIKRHYDKAKRRDAEEEARMDQSNSRQ